MGLYRLDIRPNSNVFFLISKNQTSMGTWFMMDFKDELAKLFENTNSHHVYVEATIHKDHKLTLHHKVRPSLLF